MSDEESVENLAKLFHDGLNMYNNIVNTDEATNSPAVQVKLKI